MAERSHGRVNSSNSKSISTVSIPGVKTRRSSKTKGSSARKRKVLAKKKTSIAKQSAANGSSIPAHLRSVNKSAGEIVTYVLDTNIIMHQTNAIFMFDEHEVVICGKVWEEMDRHKSGKEEKNLNVRSTVRYLDDLVRKSKPKDLQSGLVLQPPPELQNGRPHTGKIFWNFSKPNFEEFSGDDIYLNPNIPDHHVLAVCLKLQKENKNVVLISNDKLFRVFASHAGVIAEEYFSEVVEALPVNEEDVITGFHHLPEGVWGELNSVSVDGKKDGVEYQVEHDFFLNVNRNEFLVVPENNLTLRVLTKTGKKIRAKTVTTGAKKSCFGVTPRNLEQEMAIELLMDPKLPAVSLAGLAGSGKTFLNLAAGLQLIEDGVYSRMVITRSPQGTDEEIGFLPGDEKEKMDPWMGGIYDNLEDLVTGGDFDEEKRFTTLEMVMMKYNIQIKSLNFMKGRSFRNTLIIVDEAQDLRHKTLKMIATRVGLGSKIVFLGNVAQIDNNYVSEYTNGLSVFIRSSIETSMVGHVTLQQGERSDFATWAEKNL